MGKGRSKKPAAEQYLKEVEWQNQRRSSPKGYLGKWYDPTHWRVKLSSLEIVFLWTIILGTVSVFIYMIVKNYDHSLIPFIVLPTIAGIIIFFAVRDAQKK